MGAPSCGHWHRRAFCACGFDLGAPFCGDIWFVEQAYPVCPKCGGSKHNYEIKTVRTIVHGWFKPTTYEALSADPRTTP